MVTNQMSGRSMTRQCSPALEHIDFEGAPDPFRKRKPLNKKEEKVPNVNPTACHFEPEPLHPFVAWALESSGLSADAYRIVPLHRRINACLRALKVESIPEAWALTHDPESMEKVLDSLLIGVTEFFRDKPVFDELQKIIASNVTFRTKPIRVLSAGCSNGAELYSLAMLLAEAGLNDQSIMVGADCRADAKAIVKGLRFRKPKKVQSRREARQSTFPFSYLFSGTQ